MSDEELPKNMRVTCRFCASEFVSAMEDGLCHCPFCGRTNPKWAEKLQGQGEVAKLKIVKSRGQAQRLTLVKGKKRG